MKIDNSKRMDLVKGLMKEKSSTKGAGSSKHNNKKKKVGNERTISSSTHSSKSCGSSVELSISESCQQLNYKSILEVQQSWDELKTSNGFQRELGEALLVRMDVASKAVRSKIVDTLDSTILLLSPDLEQTELDELTQGLKKEGVDRGLMFQVLTLVVADTLSHSKITLRTRGAWKTVCDTLSTLLK